MQRVILSRFPVAIMNSVDTKGLSFYTGIKPSLLELKNELVQHTGGSVNLSLLAETGIATMCLNNPEHKNAITGKMIVDMEDAVSRLEDWTEGKGVLVHGAEGAFCSGGDLHFAQKIKTAEGGYKMAVLMNNVLDRLRNLPMISLAYIDGAETFIEPGIRHHLVFQSTQCSERTNLLQLSKYYTLFQIFVTKHSPPFGVLINTTFRENKSAVTLKTVLTVPVDLVGMSLFSHLSRTSAYGGGAEISVSCDFRLMSTKDSSRIGFVQTRMGLVTGWGGASRLVSVVGYRPALDLLATSRVLSADEAIGVGLVDSKVGSLHEALNWLHERTKFDASVIRTAKRVCFNARAISDEVSDKELRMFAPLWGGAANLAALEQHIKHNKF